MLRDKDIEFLSDFRMKIEKFLFLGYVPGEPLPMMESSGYLEMKEAMRDPKFSELRREINEMIPRVEEILTEFDIGFTLIYQPAPVTGRPPSRHNLFTLLLNNSMEKSINKEMFLDRIDQAIGHLKSFKDDSKNKLIPKIQYETQKGFVFIAMSMDPNEPLLEDIHNTIKRVSLDLGLVAERVDDPEFNERITDRILNSINKAEYIVVDLTFLKPNVFFEAGYAQGIGKIPIYIALQGTEIAFDLKDYPVIFFENMVGLEDKLKKRLTAMISKKG